MAARTPTRLYIILWHVTNSNSSVSISTITCFKVNVFEYNTTPSEKRTRLVTTELTYRTALHYSHVITQRHSRTRSPVRSDDRSTNWPGLWITATTTAKGSPSRRRGRPNSHEPVRTSTDPLEHARARKRDSTIAAPLRFLVEVVPAHRVVLPSCCFEGCRVTTRSRATRCTPSGTKATLVIFLLLFPIVRFAVDRVGR